MVFDAVDESQFGAWVAGLSVVEVGAKRAEGLAATGC